MNDLAEAKRRTELLRDSLPDKLEVATLGVKSKAPFQLLAAREAIIWRTEELARNACLALDHGDIAVAAILTRATTESAALVWKLKSILEARAGRSAQELNDDLMRVLVGSKTWDELMEPFNILTCVDQMDKKIPGVRVSYDTLSEFAHPNWRGTFGLYSKTEEEAFTTYFGRGYKSDRNIEEISHLLVGSLMLFEYAYNQISDEMSIFIDQLEKL